MSSEPITGICNDGYISEVVEATARPVFGRRVVETVLSIRRESHGADSRPPQTAPGGRSTPLFLRDVSMQKADLVDAIRATPLAVPLDPLGPP